MKSITSVIFKNSKRKDSKNWTNNREKILSVLSFIIVFVFLASIMGITSVYVTIKLIDIEQTSAFVNILLLMNFFLLFAKSIFESLNVLYFSKDLKILLRLPIKMKDIIKAKLLNMIVSEYEMELIMLAIPMIVFGHFVEAGILFYIYMVLILLVLPVIPISITSLIIAIIMRFTNHIKNKSKVMYITIIGAAFLVGIVTSVFQMNFDLSVTSFEDIILTANGLSEKIADSFALIKPIMNTLLNYNNISGIQNLIIYILESIICFIFVVWSISKIYLKGAIGTTINSGKGKIDYENKLTLADFEKRGKNKSYILKEFKILSRTPIFLIQCLIMPIIYPILVLGIMAFFVSFASQVGVDVKAEFFETLSKTQGQAIFVGIGQVFYMMNFCSIIAISRESKNSIISKYIPINLTKQFKLKIHIGFLVNMVSTIVVTIGYWYCTTDILATIEMFLILVFLNLICEKFKLLIDLRNPQISWDNEYTMMKQNTNVMYELFYTILVILILLAFSRIIKIIQVYLIFILMCMIIINVVINEYVYKKQKYIFRKIF